jgi:hypothetical protein
MIKRYRKWRNRRWWNSLDSKVVEMQSGVRVRVTQRHGDLIGVELWHQSGDVWLYTVVK